MSYIAMEEVFKKYHNAFRVTLLAAKRAQELSAGANTLLSSHNPLTKFTTLALEEIKLGKIIFKGEEVEEITPAKSKKK